MEKDTALFNAKNEQLYFDYDINTVSMDSYPDMYHMHWHQHVEVLANSKPDSSVEISINQKTVTLLYGDIYFIWPGELHEIIDNSSKAIIALQFSMSLLNSKKEFAIYYEKYKDNSFLSYKENVTLNNSILSDLQAILTLSHDYQDRFRNTKMTIYLYDIFMKYASVFNYDSNGRKSVYIPRKQISDKIDLACSYIKNHCDEPITLEETASYIGFSPCYFSRHFKKITTHSFVEYLILQRINRLQVLLIDKSLSITDAAYQAGFKSISTLNRTFSKYCGCSPSEYRKYYSS